MKSLLMMAFTLTSATLAHAEAPWGKADAAVGKEHHDKACVACHAKMFGGDGSKIYTRDGRVLSDRLELLQRVAACNSQMKAGWFPEEEAEVAAYLNQQYYHFNK